MARLGIFVFYDHDGVVDSYVETLLSALSRQCQGVVIAVNGEIQRESLKLLKKYSEHILIRENIGFDAGAYKDIFLKYLLSNQGERFDEVVMLNDTFYGPLYPLGEILECFDEKKADFWGITRHTKGEWPDGQAFPEHIQSYFFVIKRRMLYSEVFREFWQNMRYPMNIRETIDEFEIKFTTYFTERGFVGKALTDLKEMKFSVEEGESPYLFNSYQLIKDMRIPFLKKNSLSLANAAYMNALNALRYVEENLDYDVDMIWENILRLSRNNCFSKTVNYWELENFYYSHDRVFIYGMGRYGRNIDEYFQYRGWINSGFVISSNQSDNEEKAYIFPDISFEKRDGLIIAMGQKNFQETYPEVKKRLAPSQVMILRYAI